jgi:hypothetical protein
MFARRLADSRSTWSDGIAKMRILPSPLLLSVSIQTLEEKLILFLHPDKGVRLSGTLGELQGVRSLDDLPVHVD